MQTLTYLAIRLLFALFGLLPVTLASRIGGGMMQWLGPKTRRHRIALKNLTLVFPGHSEAWRQETAKAMWNHLGRLLAEFPALHSGELFAYMDTVKNRHFLTQCPQALFVSAHFGQWEMLTPMVKLSGVHNIAALYRHVNNPGLDTLLRHYRSGFHDHLIRKKGDNAFAIMKAMKAGQNVAMLIDQRLTKGHSMMFLGQQSLCNVVAMKLSVKTGIPIVLGFIARGTGVAFSGEILPPIYPPQEGSEEEKIAVMAREVYQCMENQILAHPEQYLWTHDRWK